MKFEIVSTKPFVTQKKVFATELIKFFLIIAGLVFFVDLVFNTFFYQLSVEGISMQPTYNVELSPTEDPSLSIFKDKVVVSKIFRYSPADIVIVNVDGKQIIKRVIAVEFQTLTLKKHQADNFEYYHFYLDGIQINESYLGDNYKAMNESYFGMFCEVEGVEKSGIGENKQAQIVLKENEFFALGDNRAVSYDCIRYGKPFNNSQVLGVVAFSYKYNQSLIQALWQNFLSIF